MLSRNDRKHNVLINGIRNTTKYCIVIAQANLCKIWSRFAQQILRYGLKGETRQGQGHSSKSFVKATELLS